MPVRYQIRLKDENGYSVAVFDDWREATLTHVVNGAGAATLTLHGGDARTALFDEGAIMEFWRRWPENGIDWYLEGEYLVSGPMSRKLSENGDYAYSVAADSFASLLSRRIIAWSPDGAQAYKSDFGGTVMREFVRENLGVDALAASGRDINGQMVGLSVMGGAGEGGIWEGERHRRNLLEVLQEVANVTGVDFDVVGIGQVTPAVDIGIDPVQGFEFRVYADQRGADRTAPSADPTGRNAAGNAPVVFAPELGNMATPEYSLSYASEANVVVVLGEEYAGSPLTSVRVRPGRIKSTRVNQREVARNASNEADPDALANVGDAELAANVPAETFTWEMIQIPGSLYGKHYSWGDRVTGRFAGVQRNQRIVGVQISIAPAGGSGNIERITCEMADVP